MVNDKKQGLIAGLILGDALGARYEGGIPERLYWKFVGKTRDGRYRYTDDTEMSLALGEALLESKNVSQEQLALHFANSVSKHRGYGLGTKKALKLIKKGVSWHDAARWQYPDGSKGNGAAMRAPVLAVAFNDESIDMLFQQVKRTSEVTHAHNDAIVCAQLIALTCRLGLLSRTNQEILTELYRLSGEFYARIEQVDMLLTEMSNGCLISRSRIKDVLGNGVLANESVFTAIFYALSYRDSDITSMLTCIARLGGDTDTIGSMAGAVYGSINGITKFPDDIVRLAENSEVIIEKLSRL
ncbi:ADP-ribosylglycohydrolase family protein [Vibrio splendidus]|nr:ADP-ribosylglycohydrolase family protein [Vibrio splendidus]MCC4880544.1 ADP-ribosylglycohydrolase family protein [Vibrio splendidus]